MAKKNYIFTNKEHPKKAIMSTILGAGAGEPDPVCGGAVVKRRKEEKYAVPRSER